MELIVFLLIIIFWKSKRLSSHYAIINAEKSVVYVEIDT